MTTLLLISAMVNNIREPTPIIVSVEDARKKRSEAVSQTFFVLIRAPKPATPVTQTC